VPAVRLLDKATVMAIASASFPTIWAWMRDDKFPRSRIVNGRSMWLSTEIDGWLAGLPVRKLDFPGNAMHLGLAPLFLRPLYFVYRVTCVGSFPIK
jgi:predicted DNA-binding transcriptional regulator AlpA